MDLSLGAVQLDLRALIYLAEIVFAEGLFIFRFKRRTHYLLRGTILLTLMFLFGALTGMPSGSSFARFMWLFLLMVWQIATVALCFQEDIFTVISACTAGFATQHIAGKVNTLFRLIPGVDTALKGISGQSLLLELPIFIAVYALVYVVFARKIRFSRDSRRLNLLSVIIVFLCVGVNRLAVDTAGASPRHRAALAIYAVICCTFALVIQVYISRWEEERSQSLVMRRLLADSEKQYEQWKTNVEQVNIAVHDIRHMLARVEALAAQAHLELPDLEDAQRAVDGFSSIIHTGNDVLDVLLRNMADLCTQNQIALNCAAYTDQLKHLDGMSLYFLFANAIDNAIESAAQIADPEKRVIDVSIRPFGDSVLIHFWNYYTGELVFADGLPVTKHDRRIHGYGMKSILLVVEQFGGVFNVQADGQVFSLDIMLPLRDVERSQ